MLEFLKRIASLPAAASSGEPGALNAGPAWKMVARWHELVRTQKRGHESPERAGRRESSPAGGRERWRDQETVPQDRRRTGDGWAGKRDSIQACSRICRGDRARLNARKGLGTLSAGQAWKMATWWHELVEVQERSLSRPSGLGGAEHPQGGLGGTGAHCRELGLIHCTKRSWTIQERK